MIRAFIAVEIDQQNKEALSQLISNLKKSNADIRWINQDQMHLTLKFLGNTEENKIPQISKILERIAADFKGFYIQLSKIDAFPNIRRPRVIWIGIDKGKQTLKDLSCKIESELEGIGFQKEKRGYKAHLTLGRVRSLKNISQLTRSIDEASFQSPGEIKIYKLTLFQSTLTPKGAIYKILSESPLSA